MLKCVFFELLVYIVFSTVNRIVTVLNVFVLFH